MKKNSGDWNRQYSAIKYNDTHTMINITIIIKTRWISQVAQRKRT